MLFHQRCRLNGKRVGAHRARIEVHHLGGHAAAQVNAFFNQTTQVAVGEDAQHMPAFVHHSRRAQALGAHFAHELGEGRVRPDLRHGAAAAHDVAHVCEQLAAERTTGVRAGEVFFPETACVEQRHRQRVAERELRRGAGRGRQIQRAGFLGHAAVKRDTGLFGQRRLQATGNGHHWHPEPAQHGQNRGELLAFATV